MFSPPEERTAREGVQGYMTEERKLMQQMAREFAREEVLPIANELDPVQGDIPQELIDKMEKLKLTYSTEKIRKLCVYPMNICDQPIILMMLPTIYFKMEMFVMISIQEIMPIGMFHL